MRRFLTSLRYIFLPRSLFGRSLVIITLPILLLQIIIAFVFFDRHWDSMSSKLVYALAGEIEVVSDQLARAPDQASVNAVISEVARSLDLIVSIENRDAATFDAHNVPVEKFYWFSVGPKFRRQLEQKVHRPFSMRPLDKDKWFEVKVQVSPTQVATFNIHERRLVSVTTYIFLLWMIGSAFILVAIAIVFMRNQIRPIHKLAVAAEKFGKGQDVPGFKPVGASEVRKAAEAFLLMRERIKRQIEQRTSLLAGVSHDLRTPLTRMKLQIALSKEGAETDSLRQDIDEMEKMIEGYLTFARGEGDETPLLTDLSPILNRIVANARRQGETVHPDIPEKLQLRLRPQSIERAIANIVVNAGKYAGAVWISAARDEDGAAIMIEDAGPGIAPGQREDVFKPFYRIEKSRNKKTGGVGLGLSISQDIVHAHGGRIVLGDSAHGGLKVTVYLPG